jgi:Retrotransposon gag protein/Zinc knuckle
MAEKVPMDQAIQRLADTNTASNQRLTDLENTLTEMQLNATEQNKEMNDQLSNEIMTLQSKMASQLEHSQTQLERNQEQWNHLTSDVQEMRAELKRICAALTMNRTSSGQNQEFNENTLAPQSERENARTEESSELPQLPQENQHSREQRSDNESVLIPPNRYDTFASHTIVIPPQSTIPSFSGNHAESPRQFLIRVKEYAETINRWNDQALLNGISQFFKGTALEWYCQLRTSYRRPHEWAEFVILFLEQFNSPVRRARQEHEWNQCKQEENETINEFIVRLRALWTEIKPNENEDDLVKHLLCKMRNNLLTMVGVARHGTLDEIMRETQKIEEILYRRAKQQRHTNTTQEIATGNLLSTSPHHEEDQFEIQAMSAYQRNPRNSAYASGGHTAAYGGANDRGAHRYTNYSDQRTINQRYAQSTYEAKCYICGKRGHIARQCLNQYHYYQQPSTRQYQKNGSGVQSGRN